MEKTANKPQRTNLRVGHDGQTATARFREAFIEWKERVSGTQVKLAEFANQIMKYEEDDPDRLKQQEISQFYAGQSDLANSARASAIAEVLGVRPAWLQHGSGPKYETIKLTAQQLETLQNLGKLFRKE